MPLHPPHPPDAASRRRFLRAGLLTGFAAGGLFDGILLHQVLQWHHLLSALQRPPFDELRTQLLADGLFHVLMYLIGAWGLVQLARSRGVWNLPDANGCLAAQLAIGFGAWQLVDALLSHWLLGLHRIRTDAGPPLLWDLGWLAVFGLPFLLGGLLARRRLRLHGGGSSRGGSLAAWTALLLPLAMLAAALPPPVNADGTRTVAVVLRDARDAVAMLEAAPAREARVVWNDDSGTVWLLEVGAASRPWQWYRHGALLVGGATGAGCAGWLRSASS
ncbi:DUF2243 domain-containing protein [Caldimonas tepidiphila]|uniref:DUF2243 domain-containing protein n=1 Tax=Caldimonas tepidiphila TaxID=2315841 RepID=UPI000E5B8C16|nr:DUF2243 domain-containing protein [Caldimonas tepidiphila]